MRNDARPVGEASPASPLGGDAEPGQPTERHDPGASDRPTRAEHPHEPGQPDEDPVMPSNDSTLTTRI